MLIFLRPRPKLISKHQLILNKKQKQQSNERRNKSKFSTKLGDTNQISSSVVISWIMKLKTKVVSFHRATLMINQQGMLSWRNRDNIISRWVMKGVLNSRSRRIMLQMHINFQHQQCREVIKILVNQTDIRFKLVQQGINMNFNQQLWLNKPQKVHKMVKIVKKS